MALIGIQELTRDDVVAIAQEALATGTDSRTVAAFLASVDWSRATASSPEIRDLLGKLEGWTTEFEEGDISKRQYRASLQRILASPEGPRSVASPTRR